MLEYLDTCYPGKIQIDDDEIRKVSFSEVRQGGDGFFAVVGALDAGRNPL